MAQRVRSARNKKTVRYSPSFSGLSPLERRMRMLGVLRITELCINKRHFLFRGGPLHEEVPKGMSFYILEWSE